MNQEQKDRAIAVIQAAPALGKFCMFLCGAPNCALGHLAAAEGVSPPYDPHRDAFDSGYYDVVAQAYGLSNDWHSPVYTGIISRANDGASDAGRKAAVIAAIKSLPLDAAEPCPAS